MSIAPRALILDRVRNRLMIDWDIITYQIVLSATRIARKTHARDKVWTVDTSLGGKLYKLRDSSGNVKYIQSNASLSTGATVVASTTDKVYGGSISAARYIRMV